MASQIVVVAAATASVACGVDRPPGGVTVQDSAGTRVFLIDSASQSGAVLELERISFTPAADFGEIVDVAVAVTGQVVVLDRLGPDVSVFDPSGGLISRFGEEGDGPGEFRGAGLTGVVLLSDTIAVPDVLSRRVSFFDLEGQLLATRMILPSGDELAIDWQAHPDGGLAFRLLEGVPVQLRRLEGPEAALDTIRIFDFAGEPYVAAPLAPLPLWCVLPGGQVAHGRTDRWDFRSSGREGTETIARMDRTGQVLGPVEMEHVEELLEASILARTGGEVPRELFERLLEATEFPDVGPVVASLKCSGNELWVNHVRPVEEMGPGILRVGSTEGWGGSFWTVVNLDGGAVWSVKLEERARITQVTEPLVVGVVRNQVDVETVALWARQ